MTYVSQQLPVLPPHSAGLEVAASSSAQRPPRGLQGTFPELLAADLAPSGLSWWNGELGIGWVHWA